MTERKFFKTTYTIVVLSEDTPAAGLCASDVAYEIGDGPCVGTISDDGGVALSAKSMAQALTEAGSEPDFFRLTEDGIDEDGIDEDEDGDHEFGKRALSEKDKQRVLESGYTVHGPQGLSLDEKWAYCVDGDYSGEYATEVEAWLAALDEIDRTAQDQE